MKTNKKLYMVIAQCDPYNARMNYNGQQVLRYDMTTPVEWVIDDNVGDGFSKDEALERLRVLAAESNDVSWFDEEEAKEDAESIIEMLENDFDEITENEKNEIRNISWFEREGYYTPAENGYVPFYLIGDESFTYDTMTYRIKEIL